MTPLHVAAHCGNVKSAGLLLERKCEVDARALVRLTIISLVSLYVGLTNLLIAKIRSVEEIFIYCDIIALKAVVTRFLYSKYNK